MDYSKITDFDINCEVLSVFSPDIKHMCLSGDNSCFYDCGPTGDGWHQIDIPDYCNNPADAWPIIAESRIAIIPDSAAGEWVAFNEFTLYEGDWMFASDPTHHSNGKNPLRCAMECFLMMQDSANVQTDSTR